MNKKPVVIVLGSLVLLGMVVAMSSILATMYEVVRPDTDTSGGSESDSERTREYRSNVINKRFTIPEGWRIVKEDALTLPVPHMNPTVVLKKDDSTCVIAKTRVTTEMFSVLKQISFGDRVYSKHFQFDGSWYVLKDSQTETLGFYNHTRQYMRGEQRIMGFSDEVFVLFTTDGSPVPDTCNTEFNALLGTVENYFEKHPLLTATSEGVLTVTRLENVMADNLDDVVQVLFAPAGKNEKFELLVLPPGSQAWGPLYVKNNRVFFVVNEYEYVSGIDAQKRRSNIGYFDPFTGRVEKIANLRPDTAYIASLYAYDDRLLYIALSAESAASNCMDRPIEGCDGNLYGMTMDGSEKYLVAEHVRGVHIIGRDDRSGDIYLSYGYGDAGFCSMTNTVVRGGQEIQLGSGDCSTGVAEEIRAMFETEFNRTEAIRVQGGRLLPYNLNAEGGRNFFFVK